MSSPKPFDQLSVRPRTAGKSEQHAVVTPGGDQQIKDSLRFASFTLRICFRSGNL